MTVAPEQVRAALHEVARHGPFFDLVAGDRESQVAWQSLADLGRGGASQRLESALTALQQRLGAPEPRPVASLLQMSAAAQLGSPLLASATEFSFVPDLAVGDLEFGFTASGGVRFRLSGTPHGSAAAAGRLAEAIRRQLIVGPLAIFTAALGELVPLSPQIVTGNIASTLVAAAQQLGHARPVPPTGRRAVDLVPLLLADGPLQGTGDLSAAVGADQPSFRRHSCCLFYRIPGGGICGDCVLSTGSS